MVFSILQERLNTIFQIQYTILLGEPLDKVGKHADKRSDHTVCEEFIDFHGRDDDS